MVKERYTNKSLTQAPCKGPLVGTVVNIDGFRITVFSKDHPPAHVHVHKAGNVAKIFLEPVSVRENYGLSRAELNRAIELVKEHLEAALTEWDSVHGYR